MIDDYSGWRFVNDDSASIPETPAIDRLHTLTMPTLIVIGERDVLDFHRMADIMTERIAGAQKVVMPRVGHMSSMENPEWFNEIVLEFLTTLDK